MGKQAPLLQLSEKKLSSLVSKLGPDLGKVSFPVHSLCGEVHWTIEANQLNLLQPKHSDYLYLVLTTSLLRALHEHAPLLWATIASADNDSCLDQALFRLSAEPPIETLIPVGKNEDGLFYLDKNGFTLRCNPPDLPFTIGVLQAMVADSLQLILDEIGDQVKDRPIQGPRLYQAALPVLQKHLAKSLPIEGKGKRSFHAYSAWLEKKTVSLFENILTEEALHRLYERKVHEYVRAIEIEWNGKKKVPEELKELYRQTEGLGWEAKGRVFCELIAPKMEKL